MITPKDVRELEEVWVTLGSHSEKTIRHAVVWVILNCNFDTVEEFEDCFSMVMDGLTKFEADDIIKKNSKGV